MFNCLSSQKYFTIRPMLFVVAQLLVPFLAAFVAASWVFPKVLNISLSKNIVDNPDARKLQRVPVPVLGGMVVLFGILVAFCVAQLFVDCSSLFTVVLAMLLMLFIGTMDDILDISATIRFFLEILVALMIVYTCGYSLDCLHGLWGVEVLPLWASLPLTIVTVVGIINAINLIDGVDGYSSGYCVMACALFGTFFYMAGDYPMTMLAVVCMASLIPFFMHNVFGLKSKMFIGDGGTLLMGCVMSVFVLNMLKSGSLGVNYRDLGFGLVPFSLAVLCVPVFDTVRVMMMRILRKTSPFHPDKTHLHHMFIELGFSHIGTTVSILTFNSLVVLGWYISYKCGASIDVQLYIVVAMSLLVTVGFYYGMRYCGKKGYAPYRLMQRLGAMTHVGRKGIFAWLRNVLDMRY